MSKILAILERFQWPLVIIAALIIVASVIIIPLGPTLGVPVGVTSWLSAVLSKVWMFVVTAILPLILKDTDGDGTPDVVDDD